MQTSAMLSLFGFRRESVLPMRALVAAVVGAAALGVAGCSKAPPPIGFELNREVRTAEQMRPEQAEAIGEVLQEIFGTPDQPRAPAVARLRHEWLAMAAGAAHDDAEGEVRGLYRQNCVICHGITGDGAGPDARTCVPNYPRDFRDGVFKFTSTRGGAKPTRADLRRTLLRGLRGTSMPSWIGLTTEQIDALVEYLKYLSLRGETEICLLQWVVDGDEPLPLDHQQVLEEHVGPIARLWETPEQDPAQWIVVPPARDKALSAEQTDASVHLGRKLYLANDARCDTCHGTEGDGKGEQTELYDDWNKRKVGATPQQTAELAAQFRLPLRQLRPRDFRQGIFHGGSDPDDLYCRIAVGIKGTPMPGTAASPGAKAILQPEEIWHVVRFIRHLAAESESRQNVKSTGGT